MKVSVSPVAVFLREEVCAVSDHLAAVSLFDSAQWMDCLNNFAGWTNSEENAEKGLRELVAKQKLRPLIEPGDVDSTLLRSQIDEQFLRAMASARAQMSGAGVQQEKRSSKDSGKNKDIRKEDTPKQCIDTISANGVSAMGDFFSLFLSDRSCFFHTCRTTRQFTLMQAFNLLPSTYRSRF